ncbi:MAG: shikimate dehydrogenase [Deltaproteobacteria bacterium]|nr:shikimate dehydrogenase [Deltaproteobacteria bacterium]
MGIRDYAKATRPTFYFIGVTTGKSSIMKVFPEWAKFLGLGDVVIKGIDFKPHDEPAAYREAVEFIKNDPLSRGALVTTHKIDLLKACRDFFEELDPYADIMGEISCISKRNGKLIGHAKDPITSGLAIEAFLPPQYWLETGAAALLLGAGGSSIAITSYLMQESHGDNRPSKIVVTNRSQPRLDEIRQIHQKLEARAPTAYFLTPKPADNDAVLRDLPSGSLVINATGLGKDAPGSPFTDLAVFPAQGIVWELNYRGDLIFLDQANTQKESRDLQIEDGWVYFIHGWTRVIAEVFDIDIPVKGPQFDQLSEIAGRFR